MVQVKRVVRGYVVKCEQCRHIQEITREDIEEGVFVCEVCGQENEVEV